jgi:hypothetical protein
MLLSCHGQRLLNAQGSAGKLEAFITQEEKRLAIEGSIAVEGHAPLFDHTREPCARPQPRAGLSFSCEGQTSNFWDKNPVMNKIDFFGLKN